MILFPEIAFDEKRFLDKVKQSVDNNGYCAIVVSEGLKNAAGKFLAEAGTRDSFGHTQLGGVGPKIAAMINQSLGYKYHWAVADYLQRSARHIASQVDVEHAVALGKAAVEFALAGKNAIMPTIVRTSESPYAWTIGEAPLSEVANQEKTMPAAYIAADGFGITDACRQYLTPLIQGEDYPPYRNGLPDYVTLRNALVPKKLSNDFVI